MNGVPQSPPPQSRFNSGRQIEPEARQTPNQKPDLSPEHTRIRQRRAPVMTLGHKTVARPPQSEKQPEPGGPSTKGLRNFAKPSTAQLLQAARTSEGRRGEIWGGGDSLSGLGVGSELGGEDRVGSWEACRVTGMDKFFWSGSMDQCWFGNSTDSK